MPFTCFEKKRLFYFHNQNFSTFFLCRFSLWIILYFNYFGLRFWHSSSFSLQPHTHWQNGRNPSNLRTVQTWLLIYSNVFIKFSASFLYFFSCKSSCYMSTEAELISYSRRCCILPRADNNIVPTTTFSSDRDIYWLGKVSFK